MATQKLETVVAETAKFLREWIHECNNAVFISKGYLEEIQDDIADEKFANKTFDHEAFVQAVASLERNLQRVDSSLNTLRTFAKHDMFVKNGLEIPADLQQKSNNK